jgi:hypothetical protein
MKGPPYPSAREVVTAALARHDTQVAEHPTELDGITRALLVHAYTLAETNERLAAIFSAMFSGGHL